jgi:hypothetical protein
MLGMEDGGVLVDLPSRLGRFTARVCRRLRARLGSGCGEPVV